MAGEFVIASVASYEFKKHNLHLGKLKLWDLPFVARTYTHSRDIISNIAACGYRREEWFSKVRPLALAIRHA